MFKNKNTLTCQIDRYSSTAQTNDYKNKNIILVMYANSLITVLSRITKTHNRQEVITNGLLHFSTMRPQNDPNGSLGSKTKMTQSVGPIYWR